MVKISANATLARRPAGALNASLGGTVGPKLPRYVTREQARAIINAAETTRNRLLLERFGQIGGRATHGRGRAHDGPVAQDVTAVRLAGRRAGGATLRRACAHAAPVAQGVTAALDRRGLLQCVGLRAQRLQPVQGLA
jgi:hypothetical protein